MVLEKIQKANDIKKLKPEELEVLAQEIRISDRENQYDWRTSGFYLGVENDDGDAPDF